MKLKSALAWTSMALLPFSAAQADVLFTGNLGYELGGDKVVEATYTDGSTDSINGGDGFYLNAGALIELDYAGEWQLGLTAGWKYSGITASNGDISLTRFPLEATLYKDLDAHRFGVGAVYHTGIKLEGSGEGSWVNDQDDLTSQVGFQLQYQYSFSDNWALGARYTSLQYSRDLTNEDLDASSAGLVVSARF